MNNAHNIERMSAMQDADRARTGTHTRRIGRQSAEAAEQTREAILLAALRVFVRQGFEATGLRDIAEEAGVTHGLIRHYYESKTGVWQAVIDFAIQRFTSSLLPGIQQIVEQAANPQETVKACVSNFLMVCARYPEMMQLMLHEGANGGERFEYVMTRFEQVENAMSSLLYQVQQLGFLQQFEGRTFLLYLFTAGGAPFGLRALSGWLIGDDILSQKQVQLHIARCIATLFPYENRERF